MMHSLRVKITAITIIAILATIIAVFIVADYTIEDERDRDSVEKMNLIGQNARQSLEMYLDSIEQSVQMTGAVATDSLDSVILVESGAAGTTSVRLKQTSEQAKALENYLSGYCAEVQETFASVAAHTQGILSYYYCIAPEISPKVHGFFCSREGKAGFKEEPPIDARELDPLDLAHTAWYYTSIKRQRPSWIGPYKSSFLGEMWICSYLMPVYKADKLIGVLGMDISVDTLAEQVSPIVVYDSGFASLLDENGRVLYHPDYDTGEKPDLGGMSLDDELLAHDSSGDDLVRYTAGGQSRQMSFCTLDNGMKLVVSAPSSEINRGWTKLIRDLLIVTALIIFLSTALLVPVVGYITNPLKKLTMASRRLASADYDVDLTYDGKDEVGVLTRSFVQMKDRLKLYIEDLNRRIYTDDLTGLPSMRHFFNLAEKRREKIRLEGGQSVMLFMNLIGMKHFNRQYGFDEGDRLICDVAEILARHFGEENVSRFNQDHFAAVASENGLEDELRVIFRECEAANEGRTLTMRAGIYPDRLETVNASTAFDRAKYACDLHRESYVSGFNYFDETMLNQVENERYVISNIDRALRENWIRVYYQPIVRASDGELCDEEALSRWIDPVKGMIPPSEFVPFLENARLIYRLDLYVLDRILEKMRAQRKAGHEIVPQSLNLSRVDFDSCDIVEEVRRRVDDAGIERDMLTIELTESSVGDNFDFMNEQVIRFRELGFKVWMDDFGSGYSTLDVLSDIEFDLVKIDMRYMRRFDDGEGARIMVIEMVRMADALGLETVCEGVETAAQVDFLREIGCTKLQGYYFGKPAPYEDKDQ